MNLEAERHLAEVLSVVPDKFELRRVTVSDEHHELRNENCVFRFYFDRYDRSKAVILVVDPNRPGDDGMKFLILRHLLHARNRIEPGKSQFRFIGETIRDFFVPLLQGDFSIRTEYSKVEDRFFDRIDDLMSLPTTHPARQMFDNCDIGWLDALEGSHHHRQSRGHEEVP